MDNSLVESIVHIIDGALADVENIFQAHEDVDHVGQEYPQFLSSVYNDIIITINDYFKPLFGIDALLLAFWDSSNRDQDEHDFDAIYQHGFLEHESWWTTDLFDRDKWYGCPVITEGRVNTSCRNFNDCWISSSSEFNRLICMPLLRNGSTFAVLVFGFRATPVDSIIEGLQGALEEDKSHLEFIVRVFQTELHVKRFNYIMKKLNLISEEEDLYTCLGIIMQTAKQFVGDNEIGILQRYGGHLVPYRISSDITNAPNRLKIDDIKRPRCGYTCFAGYTRKSFYCRDTDDTDRYPLYNPVVEKTKCQYTVPLIYKSQLVGVLNLGYSRPYSFSETERRIIDMFALQLANILYFIRLLEELRASAHRAKNKIDRFLRKRNNIVLSLADISGSLAKRFQKMTDSIVTTRGFIAEMLYPLKPLEEKLEKHNIVELINGVIKDIDHEISNREPEISIKLLYSDDDFTFTIMRHHLIEVLLNLFWNAIKAIEACDDLKFPEIIVKLRKESSDGVGYLIIDIIDNGQGISSFDPEVVFRPDDTAQIMLFSAESRAQMSDPGVYSFGKTFLRGMGLYICDHILANYGGYLAIEDRKDYDQKKGTVATIYLKASDYGRK